MSASNDEIEKLIDSLPLNVFQSKKGEINQLDCPKCPISFIKRDDWRHHIRFRHRLCEKCLVHNIDDKTVHSYCKRCRTNTHNVIRSVNYGRGHECARCCIWFTSRNALEYHIIRECRNIEDDDDDSSVSNADSSSRKRRLIPLPQDPPKRKVLIRIPSMDQNKSKVNSSSIKTSNKRNSRKVIQIHVCGLCGVNLTSEAGIEDHKTLCRMRNQIKEEQIVKSESIQEDAQSMNMNNFISKEVEIKCNEESTSSLSNNADSSPSTRSVIPLPQDLQKLNVEIRTPSIDQNKKKVVKNSIIKPVKVSDKRDSLVKSMPNSNNDTSKCTTHIPNPSSSSARFRRHQCPGCYSWFSMKHVFEYHIIKECRYIKDDDDDDTSVSNGDSSPRKRKVIPLPQDLPKQKVIIRTPSLDQNKSKVNSNSIKISNKRNPSVKPGKVTQIHVCGLCGVNLTSEACIEGHKTLCPMRNQIEEQPIVKSESIQEDAQSIDMNNFINNEVEIKCNEEPTSSLSNTDSSPSTRSVIPLLQDLPEQNVDIRTPSIDQNKKKVVKNSIIKPVKVSDKRDSLIKSMSNSINDIPKHCKRCRTTHIPSSCPANFRRHQCPGCYSWFDMEHVFEYHIRKVCPHVSEENLATYEFNAKRTAIQLPPDNNQKLNNLVVKLRKARDTYECGFCGENFTFESSVEEHKRMCPMRIQIKEEPIEESDSTREDVIDNFIKEEFEIKEEPQDEGYEIGTGTLLDTTTVKTEPIDYDNSNVEIKIEPEE